MGLFYSLVVLVLICYGIAGIIIVCWLFFRGVKHGFSWKGGANGRDWREACREKRTASHTGWIGIQRTETQSVDTFEQDAARLIVMVARIGFALAILVGLAIVLFLLLAMSR